MSTKVVFMGSPDFAVPVLRGLSKNYDLVGVVTQPDRAAGRGRKIVSPPVKILAESLGIPVFQPRRLRNNPEGAACLQAWDPALIVVAAFGQILPPEVLDFPRFGSVNVHASLLPRWRGAAPIQAAILHGDAESGITIMKMDPGLDTGPILSQRAIPIAPDDTGGSLSAKLSRLGAELLIETLPGYLSGDVAPIKQDESRASYAPMLKKEAGRLDFNQSAEELARKVKAYHPWPGTYIPWKDSILKIHDAHASDGPPAAAGETVRFQKQPGLGTADGILVLDVVQPAGKKAMPGKVFLNGAQSWGKAKIHLEA